MGLFDLFKRKTPAATDQPQVDKNLARLARVAADKRAQNYDRMEAIQNLGSMAIADAAAALLRRFTFYIEPSITDEEEKETAFRGILSAGQAAIEPIREFCLRAESLTWPLKLLEELLSPEQYVDELLLLLQRFDTEYTKNVEPKLQLIAALEHTKRDDVREAVEPFLLDVNEPVRFHSVTTVVAQERPESIPALCEALVEEESVRVRNRICEALMARNWAVPPAQRSDVARVLPAGFTLQDGQIKRAR